VISDDAVEPTQQASDEAAAAPVLARAAAPLGTDDDDGLEESLLELSRLGTSKFGLEELLTRIAGFAVQAIPGAEGAGLTLLEDDHPAMIVTTADFVQQVDDIQYKIGQGPCITAADEGQTVLSGSLGADPRATIR